eukprot:m.228623 g.228623  ORF g.228623 m.228623 type:complete len:2714 (-) comp26428_c0_seq3:87-8228(-)
MLWRVVVLLLLSLALSQASPDNGPQPLNVFNLRFSQRDLVNSVYGYYKEGATRTANGLVGGGSGFMTTTPIRQNVNEKTLEAWVQLNSNSKKMYIFGIQSKDFQTFDTIGFDDGKWFLDSDGGDRTKTLNVEKEQLLPSHYVHVAFTFKRVSSTQTLITPYRMGLPYASSYTVKSLLPTYLSNDASFTFGIRNGEKGRGLDGNVLCARLYGAALTSGQVATSYSAGCDRAMPFNLVVNGDFEETSKGIIEKGASLTGWTQYESAGKVLDTFPTVAGKQLYHLRTPCTATDPAGRLEQTFATTPNRGYSLTFFASGGNWDGTDVDFGLVSAGRDLRQVFESRGDIQDGLDSWFQFAYQFTANATTTTLSFYSGIGHCMQIDAVSVYPIFYGDEMLRNNNFEDPRPIGNAVIKPGKYSYGWQNLATSKASAEIIPTDRSQNVFGYQGRGRAILKLSQSCATVAAAVRQTYATIKNAYYQIAFAVLGVKGTETATLSFGSLVEQPFSVQNTLVSGQWQLLRFNMRAVSDLSILQFSTMAGQCIFIDTVTIRRYGSYYPNIVSNPSFETPVLGKNDVATVQAGSTLASWTQVAQSPSSGQILGPEIPPNQGAQIYQLNTCDGKAGGIRQTLDYSWNGTFSVEFYASSDGTASGTVTFGSTINKVFNVQGDVNDGPAAGWQYIYFETYAAFPADFILHAGGQHCVYIDGVRVARLASVGTTPTPLPILLTYLGGTDLVIINSTSPNGNQKNIADGRVSSGYSTITNQPLPVYITFDLGSAVQVTAVEIYVYNRAYSSTIRTGILHLGESLSTMNVSVPVSVERIEGWRASPVPGIPARFAKLEISSNWGYKPHTTIFEIRFQKEDSAHFQRFAGSWNIAYENSETAVYKIDAFGRVLATLNSGVRNGRLERISADVYQLEGVFDDPDQVERISIDTETDQLILEKFSSPLSYDSSGTGTRQVPCPSDLGVPGAVGNCSTTPGDTCVVRCKPGYSPAAQVFACTSEGTWSGSITCTDQHVQLNVTASGASSASLPFTNAIDHNVATSWVAADNDFPASLELDAGSLARVSRFSIFVTNPQFLTNVNEFQLQAKINDPLLPNAVYDEWTSVISGTVPRVRGWFTVENFNVQAREWRFVAVSNYGGTHVVVDEIRLFVSPTLPVVTPAPTTTTLSPECQTNRTDGVEDNLVFHAAFEEGCPFIDTVTGAKPDFVGSNTLFSSESRIGTGALRAQGTGGLRWNDPPFSTSVYTASIWVKLGDLRGWRTALAHWPAWVHLGKDSGLTFGDHSGIPTLAAPPAGLKLNVWYHLVSVRDTNTYTLYIDGVAQVSKSGGKVPEGPGNHLAVGCKMNNGGAYCSNNFIGLIDDVRVYDRALTATEIKAIFAAGGCNDYSTSYLSPEFECKPITTCTSDEYEAQAPTQSSDRVCKPLTVCECDSLECDEFEEAAPTATSDRSCESCTICPFGHRMLSDCMPNKDRVCDQCSTCNITEYQTSACTATEDTKCAKCSTCGTSQYTVVPCSFDQDTICEDKQICGNNEYEAVAGSDSSDRVCLPLTTCQPGQQQSKAPTATSDRVCTICPGGTSDVQSNSKCVSCPAGVYTTPGTTGACTLYSCAGGFVDLDSDSTTECQPCPNGQYQDLAGQTSCNAWTTCDAGEEELLPGTIARDRVCVPCKVGLSFSSAPNSQCQNISALCPAGSYQTAEPTLTSDRKCAVCTDGYSPRPGFSRCQPFTDCSDTLKVIGTPGTPTSDVTCVSCSSGFYFNTTSQQCDSVTECLSDEFEISPPSPIVDRRCRAASQCLEGRTFESQPPTTTSDRVCSPCSICPANHAQNHPCNLTSDAQCGGCENCKVGFYETTPCTDSSLRVCSPCTPCNSTTHIATSVCTAFEDFKCEKIVRCPSTQYEARPATASSQPLCLTKTVCASDEYVSRPATATSDTECTTLTQCAPGYTTDVPETTTSDRTCKPCAKGTSDETLSNTCTSCPGGTYTEAGTFGSCSLFKCPPGQYDDDGLASTACSPCPPATYQPNSGQQQCLSISACGAGSEVVAPATAIADLVCRSCTLGVTFNGASVGGTCKPVTPCPVGRQEASPPTVFADRVCADCSHGTYKSWAGQHPCAPITTCGAGFFPITAATTTANTVCGVCPIDSYSVNGTSCVPATVCGVGQFETRSPTLSTDRLCAVCNGYSTYQDQPDQTTCKTVRTCTSFEFETQAPSPSNNRVCAACSIASNCKPNEYLSGFCGGSQPDSLGSNPTCVPCHPTCNGCTGAGSDECKSCATDLHFNGTHCVSNCPAGTYPSDGTCLKCHPSCATCFGGYSYECDTCFAGSFLTSTSQCVEVCPAGEYGDAVRQTCLPLTPCQSGQEEAAVTKTSDRTCTDCQPGFYQDEAGRLQCKACAAGSFQNGTGAVTCYPTSSECAPSSLVVQKSGPTPTSDRVCIEYVDLYFDASYSDIIQQARDILYVTGQVRTALRTLPQSYDVNIDLVDKIDIFDGSIVARITSFSSKTISSIYSATIDGVLEVEIKQHTYPAHTSTPTSTSTTTTTTTSTTTTAKPLSSSSTTSTTPTTTTSSTTTTASTTTAAKITKQPTTATRTSTGVTQTPALQKSTSDSSNNDTALLAAIVVSVVCLLIVAIVVVVVVVLWKRNKSASASIDSTQHHVYSNPIYNRPFQHPEADDNYAQPKNYTSDDLYAEPPTQAPDAPKDDPDYMEVRGVPTRGDENSAA